MSTEKKHDLILFRLVGVPENFVLPRLHSQWKDSQDALNHYKERLRERPQIFGEQTEAILQAMQIESSIEIQTLFEKPTLLVLANRGYDQTPVLGQSRSLYQLRLQKIREQLGEDVQIFVLPVAALVGIEEEQKKTWVEKFLKNFSAVMSVGGADIAPSLYESEDSVSLSEALHVENSNSLERSRHFNAAIDQEEVYFVRHWVSAKSRAFFGICRGHQLLGVVLGFRLHPHISGHGDGSFERHQVFQVNSTRVSEDLDPGRWVLSFHHQAIDWHSHPRRPEDLILHEVAEDGTVESVHSQDGLLHGFQYHPEFMEDDVGREIFARIRKVLAKYHFFKK